MGLRFKFISCLLVISMLLSAVLPVFAQEEAEQTVQAENENQILFYENFETYSTGATTFSGYGGSAKTNVWKVEQDKEGGRHLRMVVNTSSDMHLDKNFNAGDITGHFVVSFDVMFEDYNDVVKALFIKSSSGAELGVVRFLPNGSVTLADGYVIANYGTGKFYNVAIAVDIDTNTANIYFNGKKRAANVSLGSTPFTDLIMTRFHMREVKGYSNARIDNLAVYYGTKPMNADKLNAYMNGEANTEPIQGTPASPSNVDFEILSKIGNSIALYASKNCALIRGVKGVISDDPTVVPFWDNDTVMVPLKFFAESLGGNVTWDGATSSLLMECKGKTVSMRAGEGEITIDGQSITLSKAPMLKGGSSYIPVVDMCELLGMDCFSDISDLIIYGDDDVNFTWSEDGAVLRKISESFVYDDVEGAEIISRVKERFPNQGHPRLIMTDDKFNAIRQNLASQNPDPVYVAVKNNVLKRANEYLGKKASGYEIRDGVRLIYVSKEVKNKVICLAMAYQLTFDDRYANRAWLEMYNACCFVDWHPWHMLDVGEMAAGVALGYDWLYHWLDDGQRKIIRESLIQHGLNNLINDHTGLAIPGSDHKNPLHRSWNWRGGNPVNNWRFIAGGGVAVAALAICDELSGKDLANCEIILKQSLLDIRPPLSLFAPGGAYPEGLGYWGFAMEYYNYHLGSLMSAAGSDFGYTNVPGLRHTTNFVLALNGSGSTFNYGDAGRSSAMIEWPIFLFANKYNDYSAAQARINRIMAGEGTAQDFFYYDPRFLDSNNVVDASLDTYLMDSEVYSTRSGRGDNDIWAAVHFGDNFADHGQYDMGTFVLDAMGRNFFLDFGADDYNLPNRFTNTYRYRAEGHNTIVINPDEGPGQIFQSTARIDKHESKPRGAYGISDMTPAYETWATSMRRGLKLDNYRRMVTVQDEVRLKEVSDFWWFAHTEGQIEVSEDGKSAFIVLDGKTLLAEIINGENATFSVMSAVPLPTSPKQPGQANDSHVNKLTIHIPECKDLDLAVTFKCYDAEYSSENYDNTFVPLDEWSVPDGECVIPYTYVDSISVNGKPLEGFDPNVYEYEIVADSSECLWGNRVVTATAEGGVTVRELDTWSEYVTVTANSVDGKSGKGYTIRFITATTEEPVGVQQIKPVGVKASRVPQPENSPENSIDGDLNTRWSCNGICWIEYDLGGTYTLNSMSLAFWLAHERVGQFDIEVSTDGTNYTKVFDGDALQTDGFENHKMFGTKAKYVRINCYGYNNIKTNWNSLLDVKFFVE